MTKAARRVLVPVRLRSGNVITTPLLPHLDTGSPVNIFRAEIAEILNIVYDDTENAVRIGTAGGSTFDAYGHELTLSFIQFSTRSPLTIIGFPEANE
jgi:hypothetical protein